MDIVNCKLCGHPTADTESGLCPKCSVVLHFLTEHATNNVISNAHEFISKETNRLMNAFQFAIVKPNVSYEELSSILRKIGAVTYLNLCMEYCDKIVKCKDCKWYHENNSGNKECMRSFIFFPKKEDDFCNYGERKDGENNKE